VSACTWSRKAATSEAVAEAVGADVCARAAPLKIIEIALRNWSLVIKN
jgi:hypothetical protein